MTLVIINLFINIFLNPLIVIAYYVVLAGNEKAFVSIGANSMRLNIGPYLATCIGLGTAYVGLMYLLNLTVYQGQSFQQLLMPSNLSFSLYAGVVTLFTLSIFASKGGIEGNILGFIFAPAMLTAAFAIALIIFLWLFRTLPTPTLSSPLNLWQSIALHAFNPFLIWFYFMSLEGKKHPTVGMDALFTTLISALLVYALFVLGHLVVFKIIGREFSLSGFFGLGSSVLYLLPFVIGIVFAAYKVALNSSVLIAKYEYYLNPVFHSVTLIGIFILLVNYLRYLKKLPF
jgi:hypothetical protein